MRTVGHPARGIVELVGDGRLGRADGRGREGEAKLPQSRFVRTLDLSIKAKYELYKCNFVMY